MRRSEPSARYVWHHRFFLEERASLQSDLGTSPYHAFHNGALYLASEVKALFAAGVYQIPPGHYLVATEAG